MSSGRAPFDLEPAIEAAHLPDGQKICSVELSGENDLYLGTDSGLLLSYLLPDFKTDSTSVVQLRKARTFGQKCPITFLRSSSALERLIVVCDSTMFVADSSDLMPLQLAGSPKMKGIAALCVNENPTTDDPFSVQLCLAKKKQLVVVNVKDQQLVVDRTRELPEPARALSMDGDCICVALSSHYVVYNLATGACQDLFPIDPDASPVVARVSKEEFLLCAPGQLGMFVTSAGTSERPPIQWTMPVDHCFYFHPHVISLSTSDGAIVVYSILDQKAKQTIRFSGGRAIGNFDGRLMVASSQYVFRIRPISVPVQVESLLNDGLIDEALALAESNQNLTDPDASGQSNRFHAVLNRARAQAGFQQLKQLNFDHAKELLVRGLVDPKEVISLWPRMLPSSSNFTRCVPPLHDIADVNQIAKGDADKTGKLREFLVEYLELVSASGDHPDSLKEVSTALLKLYAAGHPEKLPQFLQDGPKKPKLDFDDCSLILSRHERHHALALLHRIQHNADHAFTIWSNLLNGTLADGTFPGIEFFAETLTNCGVDETRLKFADRILKQDQLLGASVFIGSSGESDGGVRRNGAVVDHLQQYPKASLAFLEFLVVERKSDVERFHNQLAGIYLDTIVQPEGASDGTRKKLQQLIVDSKPLRAQAFLSKLESSPKFDHLHEEKALLFGKMGDHVKALKILVHKMKDFRSAEGYCDKIAQNAGKARLLANLMEVYLDGSLEKEVRDQLAIPALDLLNRRAKDMDALGVLGMLPDDWSVASLSSALETLIRSKVHQRRMLSIERSIAETHNLDVKHELLNLAKDPIFMSESSYCMSCKKQFTAPSFARYPNGILVHLECAKDRSICPVTGSIFP